MEITPVSFAQSIQIGTVDFVSPDEIKVLLDIESPESMALNTGTPHSFPRINSYVFIRTEQGYIVGQIEWITIERSAYPKRKGLKDFGLIDLPFPLRKMKINPLGTLKIKQNDSEEGKNPTYQFQRGIEIFPSVGDAVLLPTPQQLRAIIESGNNLRVKIGTSPLGGNADVKIDPDKLFGRHLAVLGNTGSGKSCSVAGLIRWSLEQAKTLLNNDKQEEDKPRLNARFIILDPNGEYTRAFSEQDDLKAKVFSVASLNESTYQNKLKVPFWFWNSEEWCSVVQASDKIQKPILIQELRNVRGKVQRTPMDTTEVEQNVDVSIPKNPDLPFKFSGDSLLANIEKVKDDKNNKYQTQFIEPMYLRIKTLLNDPQIKPIIEENSNVTFDGWIKDYIGDNNDECPIKIIDLSLVPSEVIHIITAVIARIIFESLQRYRKQNSNHLCFPTVLVMEEAHTFIKRYSDDYENNNATFLCCKTFEKIAREGRKFGLGLVISSQRPSELSPTVLSQCNTFLLHRISNDKDQELVAKLVPDNLRGLLRDLPSLPSQNAILLGWASELPVLVKMNSLPKNHQPLSDDPDFWEVWTGSKERDVDWESITKEWQKQE